MLVLEQFKKTDNHGAMLVEEVILQKFIHDLVRK